MLYWALFIWSPKKFIRTFCIALILVHPSDCWAEQPCSGYFHVAFVNFSQGTLDAPVFDADGKRLEGPNYMAELYALYIGIAPANLPPPNRAIGGYGESNIIHITVGGQFQGGLPADLVGLQSFGLRRINGVAMRTVTKDQELVIEWFGSFKRYQLQQTAALGKPWENLGEPEPHERNKCQRALFSGHWLARVKGTPISISAGNLSYTTNQSLFFGFAATFK